MSMPPENMGSGVFHQHRRKDRLGNELAAICTNSSILESVPSSECPEAVGGKWSGHMASAAFEIIGIRTSHLGQSGMA